MSSGSAHITYLHLQFLGVAHRMHDGRRQLRVERLEHLLGAVLAAQRCVPHLVNGLGHHRPGAVQDANVLRQATAEKVHDKENNKAKHRLSAMCQKPNQCLCQNPYRNTFVQ